MRAHGYKIPSLSLDLPRWRDFTGGMRILLAVVLLGALAGAGCGHRRAQAPPPGVTASAGAYDTNLFSSGTAPIITPETSVSGKIVRVNTQGRFVVVNFPIGHLPAIGQRLNVYHFGLKVGEVDISGPQYDDNIVGDLVAGGAQAGDSVRDR